MKRRGSSARCTQPGKSLVRSVRFIIRASSDCGMARIAIVRDGLRREFSFSGEQASILDAASAVIANNRNRKKKALWTDAKGGHLLRTSRNPRLTGVVPRWDGEVLARA